MSLIGHQMKELPPLEQAKKAIRHTLTQIRDRSELGWYCGIGTQTFALLTEAYAALRGEEYNLSFADQFACLNAQDPREQGRQDAITDAMVGESSRGEPARTAADDWSPSRRDILDEVSEWSMVERQELLDDLLRDYCRQCGSRTIIKPCGCIPATRKAVFA